MQKFPSLIPLVNGSKSTVKIYYERNTERNTLFLQNYQMKIYYQSFIKKPRTIAKFSSLLGIVLFRSSETDNFDRASSSKLFNPFHATNT